MSLLKAAQGVVNASSPLPWLVLSGQPSEAQLTALHAAGALTVIDLRDPMEPRGFDEAATASRLGMHYVNTPILSGALNDTLMAAVLAALRAARDTPTVLHCASANRTGGPLLAYLMLDQHMDEASAVDAAMRSGLRSAEYLEWAADYARRNS